jgi:gas vesicle protein
MNNSSKTALAVIVGVAMGTIVGLLYAPESGKETRKKLKKNAIKAKDDATAYAQETYDNATTKAETFKGTVSERLDNALASASDKADDVITALEYKLAQLKEKNAAFSKNK